jgi:hypothetical protein
MDDDLFRSVFGNRGGFGGFGGFGPFGNINTDQFHSELHKMFQEMEQTMREFQHANPILIQEFDQIPKEVPSIDWPAEDEKTTLRDSFLKSSQPSVPKTEVESNRSEKSQEPINPGFGVRSGIVI